jgi:NADPH-dependent 2,4-dienoyl-CoA reductase/sulfur reductase-like enzyme
MINPFAVRLLLSPSKLVQAIAIKRRLLGTPYWTDSWVASTAGSERLQSVEVIRKGRPVHIECDMLACGFHLVPNTELAELLGCRIENGFVAVDENQQTSREHIYCAGEPTGIGGVDMALLGGEIAGLSAAGNDYAAAALFPRRKRLNGFAQAMNRTFQLREELKHLADSSTIVCRCEDVAYGSLIEFGDSRDAKLQTRCGMGPCQGRVCGPATEFLFGWSPGSVRAPIFPVKMEHL